MNKQLITIIAVVFGLAVNLSIAQIKYAALDYCKLYTAPANGQYGNYLKTSQSYQHRNEESTTAEFYVIAERTINVQLSTSINPSNPSDECYEIRLSNIDENVICRRRCGSNETCNVLASAKRNNVIDKLNPMKVQIVSGAPRSSGNQNRTIEVFVRDETFALLTANDGGTQLRPLYQAFSSIETLSKYFYECSPIPQPYCPALENKLYEQSRYIDLLKGRIVNLVTSCVEFSWYKSDH